MKPRIPLLLVFLSLAACEQGLAQEDNNCPFAPNCPAFAGEGRWRLDVEIKPPPDSPFVAFQRANVELSTQGVWELLLPSPIIHETTVLTANERPVDADLSFHPVGGFEDRPLGFVHTVRGGQAALVPLTEGEYDIRILPIDPPGPVVEVRNFIVAAGNPRRQKELVLPDQYRRLRGVVRNRVAERETISGVEVRAVGLESGLESTVSQTGPDGVYDLELPGTEETGFRVTATLPSDLQPSWQFEQTILVPTDGDRDKDILLDLPSEAVRGFVRLEILGLQGRGGEPVGDARITLTASTAGEVDGRTYAISGRTDADGLMRLDGREDLPILRGLYRAVITPPISSIYRRTEVLVDLTDVGFGVLASRQLTLELRPRVRGRILDVDGSAAAFAELTFEATDGEGRATVITTAEDGSYSVRLDPATYVMSILPFDERDLFRTPSVARVLRVQASVPVATVTDIVLSPGVFIRGRLRSVTSAPLEGIDISLFDNTLDQVRRRVARAVSGPDGQVELLLTR